MSRPRSLLLYLLPCAILFLVHYDALRSWFFMDDFAWLGLRFELNSPRDVVAALIEPRAQGTIRVLSERLFFLVFGSVFGMKAGPFHYWVFLTQCISLILTSAIVRRLSGSIWVGFAAANAWAISPALTVPLSWLSSYNQILCACLALAAFYCLIRFVESGERKYWIWQWAFFLSGFLALEVMVAYPALACLYTWIAARQAFRRALWLWVPALAFAAMHLFVIPKSPGPIYRMTFDFGMVTNFFRYAFRAVGPTDLYTETLPAQLGAWIAISMALLLVAFISMRAARRDWRPLIGAGWFIVFLSPLLPLQNHVSDYYIAIPSFGFAMLTGWALVSAMQAGVAIRLAAIAFASIFVWAEVRQTRAGDQWYRVRSSQMHEFINGIQDIVNQSHAEAVLVSGVTDDLYISGLQDDPFRLYGLRDVYLVPGTESAIHSIPPSEVRMRTDLRTADSLLASGRTAVVAFDGKRFVDVTPVYRAMRKARFTLVHVVDPVVQSRLGSGWYDPEGSSRWMARRAVLTLDAPVDSSAQLVVSLYCPPAAVEQAHGRLEMKAFADGKLLGTRPVREGEQKLTFDRVPAEMLTRPRIEITLEVSHVIVPPGDGRELGVKISEVAFKTP